MLLTYITSAHVGDRYWYRTTKQFILNWQDQIRRCKTLVESSYHFSGVQNPTMLENVIDPIPSLQYIKNKSNQFKTYSGTAIINYQYSELLLSDTTTHDNKFKRENKFGFKYRRSVY